MILPSACLTFAFAGAVSSARKFLEGWNRVSIPLLLGQTINLDLIQMLNMRGPLDSLRSLDDRFWVVAPILLIATFLVGTLLILLTGLTMAIFYNLISRGSGGLVIDLEPTER